MTSETPAVRPYHQLIYVNKLFTQNSFQLSHTSIIRQAGSMQPKHYTHFSPQLTKLTGAISFIKGNVVNGYCATGPVRTPQPLKHHLKPTEKHWADHVALKGRYYMNSVF
jgi:hypothetical protein